MSPEFLLFRVSMQGCNLLEVGGVSPTGKSISVSVRVVRASGRGEAKLRGRARGVSILVLGRSGGKS